MPRQPSGNAMTVFPAFHMPGELRSRLVVESERAELSQAEVIRRALEHYLPPPNGEKAEGLTFTALDDAGAE